MDHTQITTFDAHPFLTFTYVITFLIMVYLEAYIHTYVDIYFQMAQEITWYPHCKILEEIAFVG